MIRLLVLTALSLVLATGCSWRDRANDYRQAQLSEPLKLPPEIESSALRDSYQVPGIESHTVLPGSFQVPQPDPLVKDAEQGAVRIQKMGNDRWILLDGSPGQLWSRLRGFLNLARIPVARTDAANGVMETGWVQPEGDGQTRERYRFRIEQGVQRGTSEIHVLQSELESGWPQGASNTEREQEMTMALAQYLADTEAASSVSMLAERNVDASGKIFLEGGSEPYIRLLLPVDRAWASLANALEKAGFTIDDRDFSEGRYWITIKEEGAESLWFRRYIKERETSARRFEVQMKTVTDREVHIRVAPGEGVEAGNELLDRVLKQIKGFIS